MLGAPKLDARKPGRFTVSKGDTALQIVADIPGSGRVYMLHLGNTRFSSNTLLVNYYQPKKRTTAHDALWAQFVGGVRKADTPQLRHVHLTRRAAED